MWNQPRIGKVTGAGNRAERLLPVTVHCFCGIARSDRCPEAFLLISLLIFISLSARPIYQERLA